MTSVWAKATCMYRVIALLFLVAFIFGGSHAAALINRAMGPWTATAVERDGSWTQMAFGPDLPRPEWVPVYPGATIVQSSKLVSAALPSGFHSVEMATSGSLEDVKQFFTMRLGQQASRSPIRG